MGLVTYTPAPDAEKYAAEARELKEASIEDSTLAWELEVDIAESETFDDALSTVNTEVVSFQRSARSEGFTARVIRTKTADTVEAAFNGGAKTVSIYLRATPLIERKPKDPDVIEF